MKKLINSILSLIIAALFSISINYLYQKNKYKVFDSSYLITFSVPVEFEYLDNFAPNVGNFITQTKLLNFFNRNICFSDNCIIDGVNSSIRGLCKLRSFHSCPTEVDYKNAITKIKKFELIKKLQYERSIISDRKYVMETFQELSLERKENCKKFIKRIEKENIFFKDFIKINNINLHNISDVKTWNNNFHKLISRYHFLEHLFLNTEILKQDIDCEQLNIKVIDSHKIHNNDNSLIIIFMLFLFIFPILYYSIYIIQERKSLT